MSTQLFTATDNTHRVQVRHFTSFGEVFGVFVGKREIEWREHDFTALSRIEATELRDALTKALNEEIK